MMYLNFSREYNATHTHTDPVRNRQGGGHQKTVVDEDKTPCLPAVISLQKRKNGLWGDRG
jgi:hypothetical protein